MSENIRGTEYWLMEEFFYQETDTPQIFREESIIALGFDIKINLKILTLFLRRLRFFI